MALRYLRLQIDALKDPSNKTVQFSEIKITKSNGDVFPWPSGTSVTSTIAAVSDGEGVSKIIDGSVDTKFCSTKFVSRFTITIDLGAGNSVDVSTYNKWCWYTANDSAERDPVSFTLFGSEDGSTYSVLDSATNATITYERNTLAYTGTISYGNTGGLPSGFTWLTYIQSDGTQYINTNFVPTENTRVVMDFQLTKAGSDNLCLFGVVGQFSFRWYGSSSVFRSNGSNGVNFPTGISGTARHTVDKTATTCILDGTYSVTNTPGTVSEPLFLFAQHSGGGSYTNYVSAKLYSCKIYESGSLVRDFIPAKSGSKVGLYDAVNGVFYANGEIGNFTAGDVYNPTAPVGKHNTLIDGIAREITGGVVGFDGTAWSIKKGRVLVDGTVYEISFASPFTVNITGAGNTNYCYVVINNTKYLNTQTIVCEPGTEIGLFASGSSSSNKRNSTIYLNGVRVAGNSSSGASYSFIPDAAVVNIDLSYSSMYQSVIDITTS